MLKLPAIKTLTRCRSANINDSSTGNAVGGTSRSACTTPDSSKNRSSAEYMTSLFPRLPILRSSKSATNLSTARSETNIPDVSAMIDVRTFLLQMAAEQQSLPSPTIKPFCDKGATKHEEPKAHRACSRLRSETQLGPGKGVSGSDAVVARVGGRRSAPGDKENPIMDVKTFLLQMAEQQKTDDSTKNNKNRKVRSDSGKRSPKKYLLDDRGTTAAVAGGGAVTTLQTPAYPTDRRRLSPVILFSNVEQQKQRAGVGGDDDDDDGEFSAKDDYDDCRPSPVIHLEKCAQADASGANGRFRRTRSLSPDEFFPLIITD